MADKVPTGCLVSADWNPMHLLLALHPISVTFPDWLSYPIVLSRRYHGEARRCVYTLLLKRRNHERKNMNSYNGVGGNKPLPRHSVALARMPEVVLVVRIVDDAILGHY